MASTFSFSLIKPVLASSTTRATWYPHVVAQGSTIEYPPTEISTADSSFLPPLCWAAGAGGGKLNIHGCRDANSCRANTTITTTYTCQRHHHQLIAPFSDLVQWVADHMGIGEFLPSNWLMDLIADFACGEIMMMVMKMRMLGQVQTRV